MYDLRLSLDLRQILPPEMLFFVRQKVQISSKIMPQIPNFANSVKNQYSRHNGQLSSFCQFFIKNKIPWSLTTVSHHVKQVMHTRARLRPSSSFI